MTCERYGPMITLRLSLLEARAIMEALQHVSSIIENIGQEVKATRLAYTEMTDLVDVLKKAFR